MGKYLSKVLPKHTDNGADEGPLQDAVNHHSKQFAGKNAPPDKTIGKMRCNVEINHAHGSDDNNSILLLENSALQEENTEKLCKNEERVDCVWVDNDSICGSLKKEIMEKTAWGNFYHDK